MFDSSTNKGWRIDIRTKSYLQVDITNGFHLHFILIMFLITHIIISQEFCKLTIVET